MQMFCKTQPFEIDRLQGIENAFCIAGHGKIVERHKGNEHSQHIFTCDEPVNSGKKHDGTYHQIGNHWYFHSLLSFTGNHNATDDTSQ